MENAIKNPCPICGGEMQVYSDSDEGRQLECGEDCDHCNRFSSTFAYGNWQVMVGDRNFTWGYDISPEEWDRINENIKDAQSLERANYQSSRGAQP